MTPRGTIDPVFVSPLASLTFTASRGSMADSIRMVGVSSVPPKRKPVSTSPTAARVVFAASVFPRQTMRGSSVP